MSLHLFAIRYYILCRNTSKFKRSIQHLRLNKENEFLLKSFNWRETKNENACSMFFKHSKKILL